jgi:hypothetical protein
MNPSQSRQGDPVRHTILVPIRIQRRACGPTFPIAPRQERTPQHQMLSAAKERDTTMAQTRRELVIERSINTYKQAAARGERMLCSVRTWCYTDLRDAGMVGLSDAEIAAHPELANPDYKAGDFVVSAEARQRCIRNSIDEWLAIPQAQRINDLRTFVNSALRVLKQPRLTAIEIDGQPLLADAEYGAGYFSRNRRLVALSKARESVEPSREEVEAERNRVIEQALSDWVSGVDPNGNQITGTLQKYVNLSLQESGLPRLTKDEADALDAKLPPEMQ